MRDILFKAKRIDNGEWVEGFLLIKYYQELPHDRFAIRYKTKGDEYEWAPKYLTTEIDPETVCQYTGLTDKNGNKIWENDIVKDKDIHLLGSVEYDEEHGMYVINEVNDGYQNFQEFWSCTEVIGNIFDNPELLSNRTEF
jgi:uncharacterized phage protein (TIGR01671 family)